MTLRDPNFAGITEPVTRAFREMRSGLQVEFQGVQAEFQILVPPGAIVAFARSTPPNGWLECNGQAVSRTTYANLFAAIGTTFGAGDGSTTFNLPDLRGEFIRGWDHGRGIDSGRTLGSAQQDAFQGHEHLQLNGTNGMGTGTWSLGANNPSPTTGIVEKSGYGTPRVAAETRPRNIALMYCIKY